MVDIKKLICKIWNDFLNFICSRYFEVDVGRNSDIKWINLIKKNKGILIFGDDCIIRSRISFDSPDGTIIIGNRCFIGASLLVCHSNISIGDDVMISWGVTIVDHDSHSLNWFERQSDVINWFRGTKDWTVVSVKPVSVQDRAWIGFGASILKGVTIGEGAVVAARSVVTKDVPPYSLVAGNPARIVRTLIS